MSFAYPECENMKVVSWALFTLHVINCIFSLMALCGLEKRICIGYVMLAMFVVFCGFWYRAARRGERDPIAEDAAAEVEAPQEMPAGRAWLMFFGGLAGQDLISVS